MFCIPLRLIRCFFPRPLQFFSGPWTFSAGGNFFQPSDLCGRICWVTWMITATSKVSSYLVLESNSTSKIMRSFSFHSSSFSKSRTLVLFSLPWHHRQWITVPPLPPKRRHSTEQIVKPALGEETGKWQPHGLRGDSGTSSGGGTRQQCPQTHSQFRDRSYTACHQCPTRGIPQASLFPTHGPRPRSPSGQSLQQLC